MIPQRDRLQVICELIQLFLAGEGDPKDIDDLVALLRNPHWIGVLLAVATAATPTSCKGVNGAVLRALVGRRLLLSEGGEPPIYQATDRGRRMAETLGGVAATGTYQRASQARIAFDEVQALRALDPRFTLSFCGRVCRDGWMLYSAIEAAPLTPEERERWRTQ